MGDTQFKLLILSDGLLYKTLEKDHTFRLIADSFLVDNCTMSGPFTVHDSPVWVTIPCNHTVNAAFVCQKSRRSEIYNPTAINETCQQGWFLLVRTGKCYMALKPTTAISYWQANNECKSINGSILSMTVSNNGYPRGADRMLRLSLGTDNIIKKFLAVNRHNLTSSLVGQPLENVAHNKIAYMLENKFSF